MAINLVQHRDPSSVWEEMARTHWDIERWSGAFLAGAFIAAGLKARTVRGWGLVLAGAGLAWWAAMGPDERRRRRSVLKAVWSRPGTDYPDIVTEASEESFPASDAPSWTPSVGTAGPKDKS
jgi:hypothetical protein